jgi:uncharacterized protein
VPADGPPDFDIRVNGAALPAAARTDVRGVTVVEDVDALSMFSIDLYNWDEQALTVSWSDSKLFAVGNAVEISLGYVDDLHKVMHAEITSLEPTFSSAEPPHLTVRGYDLRHRMTRARKTRSFSKMKDSAIAGQVAREAGLRAQVTDTKVTLPYVVQSNETDLEFLQRRADLIGFEVFVREKVLYFQPPQNAEQPARKLSLDGEVSDFSARLQALHQVGEVSVRGWDVKQKQPILGKASVGQERSAMGGRSSGPKTANKAFGKAAVATVDHPVQSKAEADQIALGRFNDLALTYIRAEATCGGQPLLQAGTVVEIEGAGTTFSGHYYVTSVSHTMTTDVGYRTTLDLRRSAA